MISFDWKFVGFNVLPEENGLQNVVKRVYWAYTATDGDVDVFEEGFTDLDPIVDLETFVPYDQITKEWTISQVSAKQDVAEMDARLTAALAEKLTNQLVSMPPPFFE